MRSANRETVGSGSRSSRARPVLGPESVADFLKEEEEYESAAPASRPAVYREHDIQRLEMLFKKLDPFGTDDNESTGLPRTPSPRYREPLLIPELESSMYFGPTDLPTPTESFHPVPSPSIAEPDTAVRLPKHVWEGMGRDLDRLETEKHDLLEKFSKLERHMEILRNEDDKTSSRLGLLKYQNEANRTQKADMGRALNEKEVKIKIQQLEIDELKAKLSQVETQLKQLGGLAG